MFVRVWRFFYVGFLFGKISSNFVWFARVDLHIFTRFGTRATALCGFPVFFLRGFSRKPNIKIITLNPFKKKFQHNITTTQFPKTTTHRDIRKESTHSDKIKYVIQSSRLRQKWNTRRNHKHVDIMWFHIIYWKCDFAPTIQQYSTGTVFLHVPITKRY